MQAIKSLAYISEDYNPPVFGASGFLKITPFHFTRPPSDFSEWDLCSAKSVKRSANDPRNPPFECFLFVLRAPLSKWTRNTSAAHRGRPCLTLCNRKIIYTWSDKIKPGDGTAAPHEPSRTSLLLAQRFWSRHFKALHFYSLSNLSVSVNFLNAT